MSDYTTEELYEQVKAVTRKMAEDAGIMNDKPFLIACHECKLPFPLQSEIGMVAEHATLAHGWQEDGEERLAVDLVWVGEGPPPEGSPL